VQAPGPERGELLTFSILVLPPFMFDDIWFTCKARVAAELRLKNNDLHSQVLLVWYAILSAAASIVVIRYDKFAGPNTDIYLSVLSVALLAVSMLVANRDYRGRALMMRANHIALKRLYDELKLGLVTPAEKAKLYSKLLLDCENHTSYDDRYFRVFNQQGLTTRRPPKVDVLLVLSQCALRIGAIGILYVLPLLLLWVQLGKN
jgi:SMODS and SLOG-associating 2TM effector domain family 5